MIIRAALTAFLLLATPALAHSDENCERPPTPTAQVDLSALSDAVDQHPFPRGVYWRISKGDASSILYGTVHVGDDRISIPPSLTDAIAASRALYLEVDDEQMMDLSVLLSRLDVIFQIDGPDLRPMFTPQEWDLLLEQLSILEIPEIMANRMKPWALGASLFMDKCLLQDWGTAEPGVDDQLESTAKKQGVPVRGLETVDDLLDLMADRDFDADVAGVKTLLSIALEDGFSDASAAMDPDWTTDLYLAEETMAIWVLMEQEGRKAIKHPIVESLLDGFNDLLLVRRNKMWLDKLVPVLEEGAVVVAVGALHLPGEDGLLYLLSQRGFEVERILE